MLVQSEKHHIKAQSGSHEVPGLVSFMNTRGQWSFLNSDWKDFFATTQHGDKKDIIDQSDSSRYDQMLREAFENKLPFTIDLKFRKKDGGIIHVREYGQPSLDENGSLKGISFIATDITDLVKERSLDEHAKEILNYILKHTSDMIAIYDANFRLEMVNPKVNEITGLREEDIVGKTYLEINPNGETNKMHTDLMDAAAGKEVHNSRVESNFTNRTYENFIFPIKDLQDKVKKILVIAHDYTEHIRTSAELENAYRILEDKNKELERSNKELGSFTYVASHDLQEPLRKIQAFGKRIVDKEANNLTDAGKEYLSRMVDAATRMQYLIDSLLEFSRTTTALRQFEMSDLNILIEEVKREMRFSIDEKQAIIESAPLPSLMVIPFQFKQLVANLFSNSLKYAKKDVQPKITIKSDIIPSRLISHPGLLTGINYCRLSFSDNGIGFENEYAEQIFELFQRLHGRAEYTGSGIGLSICKKIAENHEGFLTAEGFPGEGAIFYWYLPMKH